ncbi:hypothetical protein BN1723_019807, partial [Verticillium longisporum]
SAPARAERRGRQEDQGPDQLLCRQDCLVRLPRALASPPARPFCRHSQRNRRPDLRRPQDSQRCH